MCVFVLVVHLLVNHAPVQVQTSVSSVLVHGKVTREASPLRTWTNSTRLWNRANILGNCVPYDATTGVCDLADVRIDGMYFVDVEKGRCDCECDA